MSIERMNLFCQKINCYIAKSCESGKGLIKINDKLFCVAVDLDNVTGIPPQLFYEVAIKTKDPIFLCSKMEDVKSVMILLELGLINNSK